MVACSKDLFKVLGVCAFVVAFFVANSAITSAATTATLLPAGEGTNLAWTPKSGVTHYTMVDEASCNGTTDYVSETTVGDRDSYSVSLSSIPNGSTITNIALTPCASRSSNGGGSATMNVFHRWNGALSADAGGYALSGTTPVGLATTNFNGLSYLKDSASTFQVGAVYSAGTKGARLSRLATVITYTAPTVPLTPTGAFAVATGSQIALSWNDVSNNETGFSIERSSNGATYTVLATTTANNAIYIDTAVVPGGTYYYKIRAFNAVGFSGYSSTTSAVVPDVVPQAPTGLTGAAYASSSTVFVALSWNDNSSNETGFSIERSTDGVTFGQVGTTSTNNRFFTDYAVVSGQGYYYRVYASNAVGNSGYSSTFSISTP